MHQVATRTEVSPGCYVACDAIVPQLALPDPAPFAYGGVPHALRLTSTDPHVPSAAQNPELGNVPYVHMLALLARAAARRGLLVVLQAKILNLYSKVRCSVVLPSIV